MTEVVKTENSVVIKKRSPFKKALAVICSATMSASMVAVNAFAAEGASGNSGMYQTIADCFKDGISQCVDGVVLIFDAVIPLGIGVIGMYAAFGAGKKIFTKLVG